MKSISTRWSKDYKEMIVFFFISILDYFTKETKYFYSRKSCFDDNMKTCAVLLELKGASVEI